MNQLFGIKKCVIFPREIRFLDGFSKGGSEVGEIRKLSTILIKTTQISTLMPDEM